MPKYLIQVGYTPEGWARLAKNPQNRLEAVRPAVERAGGKIESAYFSFGDHDIVVIADMPDNVSAAGVSIAFAAGGVCRSVKTTPLLAPEEGVEAMRRAGQSSYRPAT
jgi:uncharacterized protein with GYD domain